MKKLLGIDSVFTKIFNLNLLYANPMYTSKAMKKEKYRENPEELYKSIFLYTYILGSIAMLIIYGFLFLMVDFKKMPYMLDYSIGFFLIMNIIQTFTYFFNVFYESRDMEAYMPLPVSERTVFKAKLAVVSIATIQLSIPIISLVSIFYFHNGINLLISILLGIVYFVLIGALVIVIDLWIMQLLVKTAILSKFKTSIITVISTVGMFANIVFIIMLQNTASKYAIKSISNKKIVYGFLSKLLLSGYGCIIFILVTFFTVGIAYKFILRNIEGNFYKSINDINNIGKNTKNSTKREDGSRKYNHLQSGDQLNSKKTKSKYSLFKYNLSLINDSTVITQSIIMPTMLPIIIFVPSLINNLRYSGGMNFISSNATLISIVMGVFLGVMINFYPTNLAAIIISLDRENFIYFKALPIDLRKYIMEKLKFVLKISLIVPIITIIVSGYLMKFGFVNILISISLFVIMSTSISANWLIYDYKHLMIDWHNVSDLQNRMPKAIAITVFIVFIIIFSVSFAILGVVATMGLTIPLIAFILLIAAGVALISYLRFKKFLKEIK